MTGIALLSGAAAGTTLAPVPDDDETALVDGAAPADGDEVVDRLDTWAETAAKKKASPVGKGKKGNDKGRNRLR